MDQRSNDGVLNVTNVNSNNNTAAYAMGTNNNSKTNANPIDQRRDVTNEDDTSSIFNALTVASPYDTSNSGSTLNHEPANEINSDEDTCGMDNGYNHADNGNVGAQEIIDEDSIDNETDLSLANWMCTPMQSSQKNLATMKSSRDEIFFIAKTLINQTLTLLAYHLSKNSIKTACAYSNLCHPMMTQLKQQ